MVTERKARRRAIAHHAERCWKCADLASRPRARRSALRQCDVSLCDAAQDHPATYHRGPTAQIRHEGVNRSSINRHPKPCKTRRIAIHRLILQIGLHDCMPRTIEAAEHGAKPTASHRWIERAQDDFPPISWTAGESVQLGREGRCQAGTLIDVHAAGEGAISHRDVQADVVRIDVGDRKQEATGDVQRRDFLLQVHAP